MPWGFSEMAVLHRCDGRRFLDSARRRHSSAGQVHGTTEFLQRTLVFGRGATGRDVERDRLEIAGWSFFAATIHAARIPTGMEGPLPPRLSWIPACAGMAVGGVPGCAVRTMIPACAGMTGVTLESSFPRKRESTGVHPPWMRARPGRDTDGGDGGQSPRNRGAGIRQYRPGRTPTVPFRLDPPGPSGMLGRPPILLDGTPPTASRTSRFDRSGTRTARASPRSRGHAGSSRPGHRCTCARSG